MSKRYSPIVFTKRFFASAKLLKIEQPAALFFPGDVPDGLYFDVQKAVQAFRTTHYRLMRAEDLRGRGKIHMNPPKLSYGRDGRQTLSTKATIVDVLDDYIVRQWETTVTLTFSGLSVHGCSCRTAPGDPYLCEHELLLLSELRKYVERENPGDATDQTAEKFFSALDALPSSTVPNLPAPAAVKEANIVILPRLIWTGTALEISFKIGLRDGKSILIKDFRQLLREAEAEKQFVISKTLTIDFQKSDFSPESLPWLDFIRQRIREAEVINQRMQRHYWGYVVAQPQEELTGGLLDHFYSVAEGGVYEYQDKMSRRNGTLTVGWRPLRFQLSSGRIQDAKGNFLGLTVSGSTPRTIEGASDNYALGGGYLSRVTAEEEQALRLFRSLAQDGEDFSFWVGKERLAEFYYRVVPKLLENPCVEFDDPCAVEAEALLPPEPRFTFRLDADGDTVFCEILVSYGEEEPDVLPRQEKPHGYCDSAQEARVEKAVKTYFPLFDKPLEWFRSASSGENTFYQILTEAVPFLERYGEVQGSDAFRRSAIRPMPQIQVGVSVESDLLDISILSEDIPPEELLAVLESYRRKKPYHRLKSGAFVTLSGDEQLSTLTAILEELRLDPEKALEKALKEGLRLPLYRALYLDAMLEKHNELASTRDKTYRALIRNFHTVRDAEYDVPPAQEKTLRPYQVYGYKWLRTLYAAGFGGILADEMGLGKTLQTICLFQAVKDMREETRPGLVICPASLIFNWQEEFHRFAPELTVLPVSGSAAVRKNLLADLSGVDVCITSYDLLRKDVAVYEKLAFSVMVLDEAQYIKNQKAAMTKAVKILHADHRFALTGTPIENRLAELWSIFDFLMPGFLYAYPDFLKRFETPIARNHDEAATERLRRMVGPFILRRLKGDVLKDLPPKLEEVRYTRFEEEQRKIYDGQVIRMKQMIAGASESGEDRIRIFAELTRIRQICCDPSLLLEGYHSGSAKRDACIELIQNAMGGGHRMLLFSQFTSMLALLEEDLQREGIPYYKITGSTPKEQRLRLVRAFNEGDTPVFLISLKAGGTGLNLTGADVVIHYDPWWNLAAQDQATDRAHRIGQKNQVTVYRLIVKDTIEEKILAMQEAKRDLAGAILSGDSNSLFTLSNEELLELLS